MLEEFVQEIASRKDEPALEEGEKHHNFIRIVCRDVFPYSRSPLEHDTIWEKAICN
jgi:hypothetical protein